MNKLLLISCLFFTKMVYGQSAEDYGFRHLNILYKGDTVTILIKSKKGEEQIKKPLFLFCQGSLPVPLIVRYERDSKKGIYNPFVFNTDSLCKDYHLVIISKPYVPLISDEKSLDTDLAFRDNTGKFPRKYIERNLLDYYTDRNIAVLEFLSRQSWVLKNKLVVSGHSEGSAVAAKIAYKYPKVTALIYSGGNPLGRMMTLVARTRVNETDSSTGAENIFQYWKAILADPDNLNGDGDTNKGNLQFSYPAPMNYLNKLKIPVLVTYGGKDIGLVAGADYFRMEMMRLNKTNFTFKSYAGLEHNFFPVKQSGEINYGIFNWDKIAEDWREWLRSLK